MGWTAAKHQAGWGGKDIPAVIVGARIVFSNTPGILGDDILRKLMEEIQYVLWHRCGENIIRRKSVGLLP